MIVIQDIHGLTAILDFVSWKMNSRRWRMSTMQLFQLMRITSFHPIFIQKNYILPMILGSNAIFDAYKCEILKIR